MQWSPYTATTFLLETPSAVKHQTTLRYSSFGAPINTRYRLQPSVQAHHFCEMWFLPKSVARVAAIVGDHLCHTPRH
ncbi:hypothetical protein TNCV_4368541 [Trichonephila clavipes]|nr:hypothetical protein TNCV_4368541 [Trichonephila clavipes]